MASLNPRKKVEDIIGEGLDIHHTCHSKAERSALIAEMLKKVGLSPEHASRYPHQFSGGQRQRLSIARAIIRNPEVIILDEATSALDSVSERQIQDAINNLSAGHTTFIVAHRLSTIKNADKIAVIKEGKCVEMGTFDELMEKKGEFYKLRTLQAV